MCRFLFPRIIKSQFAKHSSALVHISKIKSHWTECPHHSTWNWNWFEKKSFHRSNELRQHKAFPLMIKKKTVLVAHFSIMYSSMKQCIFPMPQILKSNRIVYPFWAKEPWKKPRVWNASASRSFRHRFYSRCDSAGQSANIHYLKDLA